MYDDIHASLSESAVSAMETIRLHPYLTVAGLLFCLWGLKNTGARKTNPNRLPHPPGPKGLPVLGAMLELPSMSDKPWLVYDKWFKKYGDIIYFEALGQPYMVLGSLKRTNDIFDKRSNNYSDRMTFPMLKMMGWGYAIPLMPYGPVWRRHRRAFHEHFNVNAMHKYAPIKKKEIQALLHRLLTTPKNFMQHIRHTYGAIIMSVTYGLPILEYDDPYISIVEESFQGLAEAGVPGAFLVDIIPMLKYVPSWFPGAGFKRKASHHAALNADVVNLPFKAVQKKMDEGTSVPCVLTSLLEQFPGKENLGRDEIELISRNTAAVAYVGGVDTSVSTAQTFFLAMAMHPEAMRKAQAEIDAVVGPNRLPDYYDRPHLPYVNAIVKESFRWQLVMPLGFAHMATNDDEYDGYFIPKGTIVMGAAWSILHDPEAFEAPEEFRPERYLKDGQIDPSVRDPEVAAFGFSRRLCPGMAMGENSLYFIVSSVLAVYDIKAPVDEFGKSIPPKEDYTSGTLSYPVPFNCTIEPRSKAAEALIRSPSD